MTAVAAQVTLARARAKWLAPAGLILLALIPILAGGMRLTELTAGAVSTAANARFLESPVPVIIHIASATVFSLLGAVQFVPALRRRGRRWHRRSGTILVPAGLLAALTGTWMAVFYPHPAGDGPALSIVRIVFGAAMIAAIVLAVRALGRHRFSAHGAWMTRAYAIGIGAGTQAILLIPGAMIFGPAHEISRTVLMGAAWIINLSVAEIVISREARRQTTEGYSKKQASTADL